MNLNVRQRRRCPDARIPAPAVSDRSERQGFPVTIGTPGARRDSSMVARVGPPATASREPRQARKGATVAATPGAGVWLARAATISLAADCHWMAM
jgi:hypothetical protein